MIQIIHLLTAYAYRFFNFIKKGPIKKKIRLMTIFFLFFVSGYSYSETQLSTLNPTNGERAKKDLRQIKADIQLMSYTNEAILAEKEKNYPKAIKIYKILSIYNSPNDKQSNQIRAMADYELGEYYMHGLGVLQDFNKSLKYYKSCATENGDKDCVIRISQLYFNAASLSNPNKKDFVEADILAYAYMKIAQSLPGKISVHQNYGKNVVPIKTITKMQESEYFKPYIDIGDALAKKICQTIPGCNQ